jgi:hypothetical protein
VSKVLIEKETLDTEQLDLLLKQVEGKEPPKKAERIYAQWQKKEEEVAALAAENTSEEPPADESDLKAEEKV